MDKQEIAIGPNSYRELTLRWYGSNLICYWSDEWLQLVDEQPNLPGLEMVGPWRMHMQLPTSSPLMG